jgi:hypothetical protein
MCDQACLLRFFSGQNEGNCLKKKKRYDKDKKEREYWAADTLQEIVGTWGKEAGIEGFTSTLRKTHLLYQINKEGWRIRRNALRPTPARK